MHMYTIFNRDNACLFFNYKIEWDLLPLQGLERSQSGRYHELIRESAEIISP